MTGKTTIEWTDRTWNPTTGCDRVSPGCDHCYALTQAKRNKAMGSPAYQRDGDPRTSGPGFGLTMHPSRLDQPLRWTKPSRIFVNSMSDLFHDEVTDEFIADVFAVMALARQHTFQLLTKRHGRMRSLLNSGRFRELLADACFGLLGRWRDDYWNLIWPLPNLWLGVTVENQQWAEIRGDALRATPAAVRFFSCEPLLGPTTPNLEGIDWVIVGGESGHGARPMHPDWARALRDQCVEAGVAYLFKQWGEYASHARGGRPDGSGRDPWADREPDAYVSQADGTVLAGDVDPALHPEFSGTGVWRVGKKAAGRDLDGRTWDEYPDA